MSLERCDWGEVGLPRHAVVMRRGHTRLRKWTQVFPALVSNITIALWTTKYKRIIEIMQMNEKNNMLLVVVI